MSYCTQHRAITNTYYFVKINFGDLVQEFPRECIFLNRLAFSRAACKD